MVTKRIAFFDFDGTITSKDTLLQIIRYDQGRILFYLGVALNGPWILAYKMGILSGQQAKQRLLRYFFGGLKLEEFQAMCNAFVSSMLPYLVRWKAVKEIKALKELGTEVVIVSASAENWIQKWTDSLGVQLIATRLELKGQRVTGRIQGRNCNGKEKIRRIREQYDLSAFDEVYVYGNSKADACMFSLATVSFYKPFR